MAIYVQIDGIKGDVTHEDHKNWIDALSLQWGVGRALMTPSGSAKNREASEPSVSEVTLTKMMDGATPSLFTEACTGKDGKKTVIHLVTTGSPGQLYMEYTLHNVLVSGYSISTGGDRPSESLSLNFTKIESKYIPYDDKNKPMTAISASYDLATTKSA